MQMQQPYFVPTPVELQLPLPEQIPREGKLPLRKPGLPRSRKEVNMIRTWPFLCSDDILCCENICSLQRQHQHVVPLRNVSVNTKHAQSRSTC